MAQGRPAHLQQLYDLPEGESMDLYPEAGEGVEPLLKRLKQVGYLYLKKGIAIRFTKHDDRVTARRVPVGSQNKYGYLTELKPGERLFYAVDLSLKEKKALLAHLERARFTTRGTYFAEVDGDGIYIRCHSEPSTGRYWHLPEGAPEPRYLTLRQG